MALPIIDVKTCALFLIFPDEGLCLYSIHEFYFNLAEIEKISRIVLNQGIQYFSL